MHRRVPVGSSITHGYVFLLENLTNVIGTAWLPALLYGAGFLLFFQHMHDWMPSERADLASVVLTSCTVILAWTFTLVIRAVIGISLTQEALGVRKDFTFAHFVIGPREMRLFFAYVRFYLVALLLYVAALAVSVGAMYVAQHYGAGLVSGFRPGGFPLAVLGAALLSVVLFAGYALAMLRLFFLLAVVASVEHETRLVHAWHLTRHSTFDILGVFLGTFLPLALATVIGLYFLVGPDQWAGLIMALQAQTAGAPSVLGPFYAAHAFVFAAAVAVLSLVGGALLAGAAAHAYRAVTGHELAEREDDALLVAPLLEPVVETHVVETPVVEVPVHGAYVVAAAEPVAEAVVTEESVAEEPAAAEELPALVLDHPMAEPVERPAAEPVETAAPAEPHNGHAEPEPHDGHADHPVAAPVAEVPAENAGDEADGGDDAPAPEHVRPVPVAHQGPRDLRHLH